MKTRFLRFPADDGLLLQGLAYEPDTKTDKVILHIHGMAGNFYENRFLDSMARIFKDNGWAFFCPNTRGHDYIADFPIVDGDKYRRIGNAYETFEESVHDIKGAIDLLEKEGFTTIVLQGHSLGAPKVAYYLATTHDKRINELILASPADMVGLAEEDKNHAGWTKLAEDLINQGKEREFLPDLIWAEPDWNGYILSAHTYIDLTKRDHPVDVINTYDKDKPSKAREITVPIFAFFGTESESVIMEPQEALDILKAKATKCPRFDTAVIQGATHGYTDHEDEVAERIVVWLKN
jgi:pimeloyl-ACP methyl ester carboxylesterase